MKKKLEATDFDFQNEITFFVFLDEDEREFLKEKSQKIEVFNNEKKYC